MKIEVLEDGFGTIRKGDIVEAIKNPLNDEHTVYDDTGLTWSLSLSNARVIPETIGPAEIQELKTPCIEPTRNGVDLAEFLNGFSKVSLEK